MHADNRYTIVLLPGMHGTIGLFQPLIDASDHHSIVTISYPTHSSLDYPALTNLVAEKLSTIEGPYILLGESFSGPICLFLASRSPQNLRGIVLAGSFIVWPNVKLLKYLPWKAIFSLAPVVFRLRKLVANKHKSQLLNLIQSEVKKVSVEVLTQRLRQIAQLDASDALSKTDVPILYLRGTKDLAVPRWNVKGLQSIRPIEVHKLQTPHFILQSAPKEAWHEIKRFCEQCMVK